LRSIEQKLGADIEEQKLWSRHQRAYIRGQTLKIVHWGVDIGEQTFGSRHLGADIIKDILGSRNLGSRHQGADIREQTLKV